MEKSEKSVKKTRTIVINNSVVDGVMSVMDSNNLWTGTMTQLGDILVKASEKTAVFPGSPSALRVVLNRVINRLRCRGVSVKFNRTKGTRYVRFATR